MDGRFKWISPSARGIALFLGLFSLLNVAGQLRCAHFDATLWWIDLRPLPPVIARIMLALSGLLLAAFAVRPALARTRSIATIAATTLLMLVAGLNAVRYYIVLAHGRISTDLPIPLSLAVFIALAFVLIGLTRRDVIVSRRSHLSTAVVAGACLVLFPLAQMARFGRTDYRRKAEAIVVLGARTHANGYPSEALRDRVMTACRLYHQGLAPKLIFSGGPGDGAVHETQAMRQLALAAGVNEHDIVLDPEGLNTAATARNTAATCRKLGIRRLMAVSHFYHLPRVKMTFQREGWEVYTVPAQCDRTLRALPWYMAREVVALWTYYLAPLGGS